MRSQEPTIRHRRRHCQIRKRFCISESPAYRTSPTCMVMRIRTCCKGWCPATFRPLVTLRLTRCQTEGWLRRNLEVIIGGQVLEEVALLLHDAVELINVDLTIAITVSLVDHVLELLIIDVL